MEKYSKKFIKETIKVWQPYSDIPLLSNDAIEITENITALFNFLITEEKEPQDKSIIQNKTSKEVKK